MLEAIGAQLVDDTDASTFVAAEVDHNSTISSDGTKGGVELRTTLTLERAQGLTSQTLGMHANSGCWPKGTSDERQMFDPSIDRRISAHAQFAVDRRNQSLNLEPHAGHRTALIAAWTVATSSSPDAMNFSTPSRSSVS